MKLTGRLKEKVLAVDTKSEKKAIIAEAGMILSDEELDSISGGNWEYDEHDPKLEGEPQDEGIPRPPRNNP